MKLLRRVRYLFRQRQHDRELAEEIEFHRAMNPDPRQLGNITLAKEDARAVWIWPWLQSVWQDVTYALRSLRKQPGFTLVALLTLGTAIGINTSYFTVFNAIALRLWPVKDPSRIVKVFAFNPKNPKNAGGLGVAEYRYIAEHSQAFSGVALARFMPVRFGFEPFGKTSHAYLVGGDHFRVLGVGMHLGRGFLQEEDSLQTPEAVTVLSFAYWRDHFASDPAIVGKPVLLDEVPFTVVGVTTEDFTGTSDGGGYEDLYLPLPSLLLLRPTESWARTTLTMPDQCCDNVLGRLAPGVSRAQAEAELKVLDRQFQSQFGAAQDRGFVLAGSSMLDSPGRKYQAFAVLGLLFVGVTLVVLLACANVGNLLIARAEARRKEIEIRRAVGAGRGRIVRQLMTESLLLALGAAALGLPIAYRLPLFIISQSGDVPALHLTPDGNVLGYAVALAAFACIGFGLAPALHGTRPRARSRLPLRSLLLAAQVALSVILLTGALLALQGVARLRMQDPGFAIEGVSVVTFDVPARSSDSAHALGFYTRLQDALASVGQPFGITAREPLSNSHWLGDFRVSGHPESASRSVVTHEVTGGYFDVLKIPVVAGRNFEARDSGRNVVLINETLQRLYWNSESAVGQTIVSTRASREIVGVVKDAYMENLDRVEPTFYLPFQGSMIPKVLVPSASAPAVAALVSRIEARTRAESIPLQSSVDRWFSQARIGAEIAGMLGTFALILATVGMSGVFAYVVQQRTKEIGIRMALGARPAQVVGLVLGGSSRAIAIGLGLGVTVALFGSRLMRDLLYGVSPLSPIAYVSVAGILALAGLAASFVPARRAARVDPSSALRNE